MYAQGPVAVHGIAIGTEQLGVQGTVQVTGAGTGMGSGSGMGTGRRSPATDGQPGAQLMPGMAGQREVHGPLGAQGGGASIAGLSCGPRVEWGPAMSLSDS
jgi:hypothetical protein